MSSQRRHVSTIGKKLLNSNTSPTCSFHVVNFRLLAAEINSLVWGTPATFDGYRVLASLLQRRHSPEANQTAPSLAMVPLVSCTGTHTFLEVLAPWRNFATCTIHSASKSCVLLYWQIYCTALQQRGQPNCSGVVQGMELRNFRRGRHLYSAGRPSRWASAHILVMASLCNRIGHYIFALWYLSSFFFFFLFLA